MFDGRAGVHLYVCDVAAPHYARPDSIQMKLCDNGCMLASLQMCAHAQAAKRLSSTVLCVCASVIIASVK